MNPQDNTETDTELMGQLRARHPQALAEVYDRYGRLIYSLLLRITHDQSVAEDLVHELFVRFWNRAYKFDSRKGTLGVWLWLLSVARNMALDHVRLAPARFVRPSRETDFIEELSNSGPINEAESIMVHAENVKAAVFNLPPDERQVLEFAYFEGCSQLEIANRLREPLETTKSRMKSALNHLRLSIHSPASNCKVLNSATAEVQTPQAAVISKAI